jgi:hypothetical protein
VTRYAGRKVSELMTDPQTPPAHRALMSNAVRAWSRVTAIAIGDAFRRRMAVELAPEVLAAIDAENARRADNTCATHDHLDANEVMAEAFAEVTTRDPRPDSDGDAALWNAAWDYAKAKGFAS